MNEINRRDWLKNMVGITGGAWLGAQATNFAQAEEVPSITNRNPAAMGLNVKDFGAKGNGQTDDTAAFKKALLAADAQGGSRVFLPPGTYPITEPLEIPRDVVLEGVFKAPTIRTHNRGSCIWAYPGKGKENDKAFITLNENSTLCGLSIFYPEQKFSNGGVIPYPWTIAGQGDNCSIVDVLLVNPYKAVDFGTKPAGRHLIKGLYAQVLKTGIFVDQCYDVGRIENVHIWPFWDPGNTELHQYTANNATAFILGRCDWEYITNCFCIFQKTGFQFIKTAAGEPNVLVQQSGSDVGPNAISVLGTNRAAGISFSNCQLMAGVNVEPSNRGPVKFSNCTFIGVDQRGAKKFGFEPTKHHLTIQGAGRVSLSNCTFTDWGYVDGPNTPAIKAISGGLTAIGCEFMAPKLPIECSPQVIDPILLGNHFRSIN